VRLHRFTGGSPLTRSELEAQIAKWQGRASPDESQIWLSWIVRLAVTGAAVGYVQATITNGCAAIAYVIGTTHSGQGFATEASRAMCRALRERFGVEDLVARIHPQHSASRQVARHVGLVLTGAFDANGEEIWKLRL
jgi:RimJ/RimL family protein N-acetyltransferase